MTIDGSALPPSVDWDQLLDLSEAAFDDAPVGMALTVLDADGRRIIHVANRALASFLGTTPEELSGTTFNELTHPDDLAADDIGADRLIDGSLDVYRRHKRYRHRDGHYVWAELHARALRTTNEATVTLAHIIDIADRMQLERALAAYADDLEREVAERTADLERSEAQLRLALDESRAQREQLEFVLDAAKAAVGEWNVPDETLQFSASWYRLLGYEPDEVDLGTASWHDHVHPDDWPVLRRMADQSNSPGEESIELTYRVKNKDGSWRWTRHRGVVTEWTDDATPARVLGIDLDVTEQRSLEQRLVHSAKMQSLGAFAGGIAHDFNNVLAILQGHTEALERTTTGLPLPDEQLERIAAMHRAIQRATSLVRNLMLINRPAVGGRDHVDLADLLRRSSATLPYLLGEDVRLEITVPPEAVIVPVDEARFEAVILNLVANARDAMPNGGTLTITLETVDGTPPSALLRVTDTGVGMDRATLELIFDPFFTTKTPGIGTGLGLATTYATITGALGTITADSTPRNGTTISISMPLAIGLEIPDPASPQDLGSTLGVAMLVVEDEAELLELTVDVLRERGFRVHSALDAGEALEILEHHDEIELVITDAVMPGMSGPQLAAIIRRRWPGVKILFISGYAAESPRNAPLTDAEILTKPVAASELVRAVLRTLRSDWPIAATDPTKE